MNKRLQELYLVASEQFKIVQDQGLPAPYQTRAFAEKFAELIVKECTSLFDGTKEMKTVGMLTHNQVVEQIKKHFGVEE